MTYWKKRLLILEESRNKVNKEHLKVLEKELLKSQRSIENQINAWYQRLADSNGVPLQKAKELLNRTELREFRWTLEDYIKFGKKNALSQAYLKQLENASAKAHITRLQALEVHMRHTTEQVFSHYGASTKELIINHYANTLEGTTDIVKRAAGIDKPSFAYDKRKLDAVLSKPWTADGKTFSERIWIRQQEMNDVLHRELTNMCITGQTPDNAIRNIQKEMNVTKYQAKRLVHTESAHIASKAAKDSYDYLGTEKYEILAEIDGRTTEICLGMNGKVFDVKDYEEGVTAPPFHVNCQTITAPWFEDEAEDGAYEWGEVSGEDTRGNQVIIDELTPCLIRNSDGVTVKTSFEKIKPTSKKFKDWQFDWKIPEKNQCEVFALKAEGDPRIQGLLALRKERGTVKVELVESAPHNSAFRIAKTLPKEYNGVGAHLFAEAVKQSFEAGNGGHVYFVAKTTLIPHYEKELGAVLTNPKLRIMEINERSAFKLYEKYYGNNMP